MKKFYERYAGHNEKVQRNVALLPWSHNMLLLSKGLDDDATLYYATKTVEKERRLVRKKKYESKYINIQKKNFTHNIGRCGRFCGRYLP